MKTSVPGSVRASRAGDGAPAVASGATTQSVCAQCGSQFSSLDDVETFCATCLLHVALSDEHAARLHRFDQYELITGDDGTPIELGRGAMGVTYRAFDTNLRYEVALKVIHPRYLADESSRARFLSEARRCTTRKACNNSAW
jgi:hypothetical protein